MTIDDVAAQRLGLEHLLLLTHRAPRQLVVPQDGQVDQLPFDRHDPGANQHEHHADALLDTLRHADSNAASGPIVFAQVEVRRARGAPGVRAA